ncbi:MAG: polyhydroxyalkanoic acid system family protein [Planctomycetota bacterium]
MPKFNVAVPHTLGREDAVEKLKHFSEKIAEFGQGQVKDIEQAWDGDQLTFSFKTVGVTIAGTMDVGDDEVAVQGDLPFAAALFKGKIESSISEQLQKLLR